MGCPPSLSEALVTSHGYCPTPYLAKSNQPSFAATAVEGIHRSRKFQIRFQTPHSFGGRTLRGMVLRAAVSAVRSGRTPRTAGPAPPETRPAGLVRDVTSLPRGRYTPPGDGGWKARSRSCRGALSTGCLVGQDRGLVSEKGRIE